MASLPEFDTVETDSKALPADNPSPIRLTVAPVGLSRLESGHDLFALARREEVIVWGARRAVWMSGYFYNDGRVREVYTLDQLMDELSRGPRLVLCGPQERPQLLRPTLSASPIASGPRGTSLVRVSRRPLAPEPNPAS